MTKYNGAASPCRGPGEAGAVTAAAPAASRNLEVEDHDSYMRAQSKNATRAIAIALRAAQIATPQSKEIDTICAELKARSETSPPMIGQRIARAVANAHGITYAEIIGNQRSAHIVAARREAIHLISTHTTLSLPQIARIFGDRDHTTIIHYRKVYKAMSELKAKNE